MPVLKQEQENPATFFAFVAAREDLLLARA
jgi:hypothetical protein